MAVLVVDNVGLGSLLEGGGAVLMLGGDENKLSYGSARNVHPSENIQIAPGLMVERSWPVASFCFPFFFFRWEL